MNGFGAIAGLALLLVRPGFLVLATPFLGSGYAPAPLRVGLTLIIAIVLAPFVAVPEALTPAGVAIVVLREVGIGLALSLAIRIVVLAADFAGHLTGYQIGLSMGSLIDPQTGVRNNTIAILYANLAIIMSFATNAHHSLLRALADSYRALPIGLGGVDRSLADGVAGLIGAVFVLGVRIAMPVVVVLLLVELALGILARVAPSLNMMTAGAPIRLIVGLLVVAATVTSLPPLFSRYLPAAFTTAGNIARALR